MGKSNSAPTSDGSASVASIAHIPSASSESSSTSAAASALHSFPTEQPCHVDHDPNESKRNLFRGAGASFVNVIATFPMNKVMFRQQAEGHTVAEVARHMRQEGMGLLYRGIGPPLVQKTVSMSLMFGAYDYFYYKYCDYMSQGAAHILAAMTSGTFEASLAPFERVQTLLQSRMWNDELADMRHSFLRVHPHGWREHYRGLSAVLARNGPSTALFFGCREPIRDLLPPGESPIVHTLNDFISGAVLGAAISTLFYPLNTVRIHMQSRIGGPHLSIWRAFQELMHSRSGGQIGAFRSIAPLYRGVWMNASRALISWGIINATYELLKLVF